MCWILYVNKAKKQDVNFWLEHQKDRWLHSIWYVQNSKIKKSLKKTVKEYEEDINKEMVEWESILFHHRKASVGSINLDNAHPYQFDFNWWLLNFMQNGTTREFGTLADIYDVFEWYDDRSDTKMLWKFLSMNAKSLISIKDFLIYWWKAKKMSFWIILAEFEWKILLYSDWARECFIDRTDNKINTISNYSKENKVKHYVNWWVFYDQDSWNILDEEYVVSEKEKVVQSSYYWTWWSAEEDYNYYGYDYQNNNNKKNKKNKKNKNSHKQLSVLEKNERALEEDAEAMLNMNNIEKVTTPEMNRELIRLVEKNFSVENVKYKTLLVAAEWIDLLSKWEFKKVRDIIKTEKLPYLALVKMQWLYTDEEDFDEIFSNQINQELFEKFCDVWELEYAETLAWDIVTTWTTYENYSNIINDAVTIEEVELRILNNK